MKNKRIIISLPEEIIFILEKLNVKKSKYIREAVKEKIERELKKMMMEGYKQEKNLEEWEITAGEGID